MDPIFEKNLITTKDAGELSGYSSDYLARLARSGKISGKMIGHSWFVDKESLANFLDKQGIRKTDYARALARERETEYRKKNSFLHSVEKTLSKPLPMPSLGVDGNVFRSQAIALSVAFFVVVSGAFIAKAAPLSQLSEKTSAIANEVVFGFRETFGDIPSRIASKINSVSENLSTNPARVTARNEIASEKIAPTILMNPDLSLLRMVLVDDGRVRIASHRVVNEDSTTQVSVEPMFTSDDLYSSLFASYELVTHPSRVVDALANSYIAIGTNAYSALIKSLSIYSSIVEYSGTKTLSTATIARDVLYTTPRIADYINLAFGNVVINATHSSIRADVSLAYGTTVVAPESARVAFALIGNVGDVVANTTEHLAIRTPTTLALVIRSFSEAGPRIAQAVFDAEYSVARPFVALVNTASGGYLNTLVTSGNLAYSAHPIVEAGYAGTLAFSHTASSLIASAPATLSANWRNAYLGALGKTALTLDTIARVPKVATAISALRSLGEAGSAQITPLLAAVAPTLSAGEQIALVTYKTIGNLFDSANRTLAALIGPPPIIVMTNPTAGGPKARVTTPATTTPSRVSNISQTSNSYPTYTTVVQGVSQDVMNQSLASLRADLISTMSGMIQPVSRQVATNVTTIQQINMIQDLSNLIVRNGDFRGGTMTDGISVSATTGTFANLTATTTTITGDIAVSGDETIDGSLTVGGSAGSGTLSVNGEVSASYFTATSTTATSTFAGSLAIGTTTPWGNNLFTVGTSSPLLAISSNTGRIGIGTTNPTEKLTVEGNIQLTGTGNFISGANTLTTTDTENFINSSIFGISNTLSNNSYIFEGSIYGESNTLSGNTDLSYSSLYGSSNNLYGTFSSGSIVGGSNNLYGTIQTNTNIFGNENTINGAYNNGSNGNVFVAGTGNTIGRSYAFTVSGTTVTIAGDITPYISAGSYSFNALTGGTNGTLYNADKTISNIAYAGGNTTFTIDSVLGDRTGGRFMVENLHDVVVFGNSQEVYRSDYYTLGGVLNVDGTLDKVGIGTTSPGSALSVNGSGYFSGNLIAGDGYTSTIYGPLTVTGTSTQAGILNIQRGLNNTNNTLSFNDQTGSPLMQIYTDANTGYGRIVGDQSFITLGTLLGGTALTIDTANDVSISGTTGLTLTGTGAGLTFSGTGNHDITASAGTLRLGSNTVIGNIQALDNTVDIGTPDVRFDMVYANEVNALTLIGTISGGNILAETVTINSDNTVTNDLQNSFLVFSRGSQPGAHLEWNADTSAKRFEFNQPIYVQDSSHTSATSTLLVQGWSGQTSDIFRVASSSSENNSYLNVTSTGNVGIGTTTPYSNLSVQNSYGNTSPLFSIASSTSSTGATASTLMTVLANGYVGIGTASPTSRLVVNGDITTNGGYLYSTAISDGIGQSLNLSNVDGLRFRSGSSERMRIDISGNVGIGTTSPLAKLDILNTLGGSTPLFSIASSTAGLATSTAFYVASNGNVGIGTAGPVDKLVVAAASGANGTPVDITLWGTGGDAAIHNSGRIDSAFVSPYSYADALISLQTPTGAGTWATALTARNGNIGIGTTNPGATLQVGTNTLSVSATTTLVGIGTTNPISALDVKGNSTDGSGTGILRFNTNTNSNDVGVKIGGTAGAGTAGYAFLQGMHTGVASDLNLILNPVGGNIGIGTTTPANKLDVYGDLGIGTFSGTPSIYFNGANNINYITKTATNQLATNARWQVHNGTAAAPGTAFSSDITTGFYLPSAGNLGLVAGGVEGMRIQTNGNIGIGTTSPYSLLSISNNLNTAANTPLFTIASTTAGTATSTLMTVLASGYVGIGTANPTVALTVSGATRLGNTTDGLQLTSNTGYGEIKGLDILGNGYNNLWFTTGAGGPQMILDTAGNVGIGTTSPLAKLDILNTLGGSTPLFSIASSTAGLATSTAFYVASNGNVGVGTAAPLTKLWVYLGSADKNIAFRNNGATNIAEIYSVSNDGINYKSLQFNNSLFLNSNNVGVGTTTPNWLLQVAGTRPSIALSDTSTGANLKHWLFSSMGGNLYIGTSTDAYATSTPPALMILNNGNVGIGTTSPDYKLDVAGSARLGTGDEAMRVASNGYVGIGTSSPAYKLDVAAGWVNSVSGYKTNFADYAEYFWTEDTDLKSGEVVCVDIVKNNAVKRCERGADNNVMGIVSTNPAIIGNSSLAKDSDPNYKVIGMLGQVPAMVSTENGPISVGDSLTSASSTPGYAMRADAGDSTVGVALESLSSGTGTINVLISRRNKSLTVEQVEGHVTERIANMKIEDRVQQLVTDATNNLVLGKLTISGTVSASAYEMAIAPVTGFMFGTTSVTAEIPSAVLTADGRGVDIYKLATYNLSGMLALATKIDAHEVRLTALETRVAALENGTISSDTATFSTTSLASALNSVGVFISKGFAQFGMLVADQFVAATNSAGSSSAGTITVLAGNTVAQVTNDYVKPSSKIFVTLTASTTGSWYISDKQNGSFKLVLENAQPADVSFDYFLVQTEGQMATSTPEAIINNEPVITDNPQPAPEPASTTTDNLLPENSGSNLDLPSTDSVPPVVTLIGDAAIQITTNDAFTDSGATATDDVDGDLTANIVVTGSVDTAIGTYTITYTATDAGGNVGTVSRLVTVVEPVEPVAPAETVAPAEEPIVTPIPDTAPAE